MMSDKKLEVKHLRYMSEKFREISEAQMFQVLSKEKKEVRTISLSLATRYTFNTFLRADQRGGTKDVREIVEEY